MISQLFVLAYYDRLGQAIKYICCIVLFAHLVNKLYIYWWKDNRLEIVCKTNLITIQQKI